MAKARKTAGNSKKKPIEQYAHKGKQRTSNPPVGFENPAIADFLVGAQKLHRKKHPVSPAQIHRRSGIINNPIVAMTASTAPNRNGAAGPYQSHKSPAITLAGKAATPKAALKMP